MTSTTNSSWRTIGGTQSYQQLNSINANYISTDTFNMRSSYEGLFQINGFLKVNGDVFFYEDAYVYGDLTVYGNTYQKEYLYLGHGDTPNYFYGTNTGIGLNTNDPTATFEIHGNTNLTMNIKTTSDTVENYLATSATQTTVGLGSTLTTAFVRFYDISSTNVATAVADSTITSTSGNLYIDTAKTAIFQSRVLIAPVATNPQHLNLENLTIYDTPTEIFDYALYGNLLSYSGTSITGIASEDRSTTFLTLNTKNLQGVGLGGGVYQNYSVGVMGTYDTSGLFSVAQTILSAEVKPITNKISIGFNTIAPEYGIYTVDLNGPMRIRYAEVNNRIVIDFEFHYVVYCAADPNYGVAVGSPTGATDMQQYILYTTDSGINWNTARVDDSTDLELTVNTFTAAYYQTADLAVIAGNGNYMYYSTDYGASWTKYTCTYDYIDFVAEDSVQTLYTRGLYITNSVIFGGYYNENSTEERGFYAYYTDTETRHKINVFGNSDLSFVSAAEGTDGTFYFLAQSDASNGSFLFAAEYDFDTYNFTYDSVITDLCYNYFEGKTFVYHYVDSTNGEFLVGSHIVYKDAMDRWIASDYTPPDGVILQSLEMLDAARGVAVGTGGTFIYTTDAGVNWAAFPYEILNSYGNASLITDSGIDLLNIHSYDEDTFIISYAATGYQYGTQSGESKIYHCYVPTMFNRKNTFVMDICGSVRVTGDFNVGDSDSTSHFWGDMYVDGFIDTETGVYVRGETNSDYFIHIGTVDNPDEQISQGTLKIQGQNGEESYNTWSFRVGATESTTSTHNTKRLRIKDETSGEERMTIDQYGRVGIATDTPVSTLEIAGITTVSDITDATDIYTGSLQVAGGASIQKALYVDGITHLMNTSTVTSITTGALQVTGGVSTQKSLFTGGNITIKDDTITTNTNTGALMVTGGISTTQSVFTKGNITIKDSTITTDTNTGALMVAGGISTTQSVFTKGNITIKDSTITTDTNTGALMVAGGISTTQSVFTKGNITIKDSTITTDTNTGALMVAGGISTTQSLFTKGNITVRDTTAATNYTTGALLVAGGAGIRGNVWIEQDQVVHWNQTIHEDQLVLGTITTETGMYIKNPATNSENFLIIGTIDEPSTKITQATLALQGQNGDGDYNTWSFKVGTTDAATSAYDTNRLRIIDDTNERFTIDSNGCVGIATDAPVSTLEVAGITTVSDTTDATDTTSGALQVAGGAAIEKALYVAGIAHLMNTATVTSVTTGALQVTGGVSTQKSLFTGGNITIKDATTTTNTNTGALMVSGGVGILQSIFTGGNITIQDATIATNTNTGALMVTGGISTTQSVFTKGNITIKDSTKAINTNTGALLVAGGISTTQSLFTGGNITIRDKTTANSPITGALLVAGGAGICGNVWIKQDQTIQWNQTINKNQLVQGTITTETGMYIANPATNTENFLTIGTIDEPYTKISQATLALQGQNGDGAYNTWHFKVGTTDAATSTYDTNRLRIIDDTNERFTIDTNGYVGIATDAPVSTLEVAGITTISDTTDATDTTSGALQVAGGISTEKALYVAGITHLMNTATVTSTTTGALQVTGGASVQKSFFTGGNITIKDATITTNTNTGALMVSGGISTTQSVFTKGNITIKDSTIATDTNTGALMVTGGISTTQSLFTKGNITIRDTTKATNTTTGALMVVGGISTEQSIFTKGNITIRDTTTSTSPTTGALLVAGGAGIQGTVWIEQDQTVQGTITTETGIYIENPDNYSENFLSIGTIDEPYTKISQATLALQGKNGDGAYNTWRFKVGTTDAATSTYDTNRLRIVDDSIERVTIDSNGCVGIATDAPVSTLEVAGITTISDTTESTSTTTGALQVAGGISTEKALYVAGVAHLMNSEEATSITTGALQVTGGISTEQSIFTGGNITIQDATAAININTGALMVTGGISTTQSIFTGGNITIQDTTVTINTTTGAFLVSGGAAIQQSLFTGGNITVRDQTKTTNTTTGALQVAGGISTEQSIFTGGNITIRDTTAATSPTTGAFLVAGGVGIQGTVWIEQDQTVQGTITTETGIYIENPENYSENFLSIGTIDEPYTKISQATLALQGKNGDGAYNTWRFKVGTTDAATSTYDTNRLRIVDDSIERFTIDSNGCIGIATDAPVSTLEVAGITTISDTTESTSTTTGALQVAGGISTEKSLYVAGTTHITNTGIATSTTTGALQVAGGISTEQSIFTGGNITIQDQTAATNTTTGALIVSGGISTTQSIFTGGNITIQDATVATNTTTGAFLVSGGAAIQQSLFTGGNITIRDTTKSTSPTTGALLVAGGISTEQSIFTGGNITIRDTTNSGSISSGALLVAGGMGITRDVYIGNILYVEKDQVIYGKLTVNGSVEITGTDSYKDYIQTIGSISNPLQKISQGTVALQGQNGAGNYGTWKFQVGTANPGTSSYDTTRLRIVDDTDSGGERFTIDTFGYVGIATTTPVSTLEVAGITTISDTTDATNTTTGALQVAGGVSIEKALYVGDTIHISGAADFESTVDFWDNVVFWGDITTEGDTTIRGNLAVAAFSTETLSVSDTTNATSTTTGALQISGGASITKALYVGQTITTESAIYAVDISATGIIATTDTTSATSTTTGALQVAGGAGIAGDVMIGGTVTTDEIYVNGIFVDGGMWESATTGSDYTVSVGSIVNPASMCSQGTVLIQGQNGMENYSIWTFSVGATVAGTSSYETTRLRVIDYNQDEERMTIDMNGYVGIGTTEPASLLDVAGDVNISGTATAYSYATTSDYRIKEDIETLDSDEYMTEHLRPVSYHNMMTEQDEFGFIAHEVAEIYPFMVVGEKDGEQYQRVNYAQIIATLVHDLQLLRGELKELRCRLL